VSVTCEFQADKAGLTLSILIISHVPSISTHILTGLKGEAEEMEENSGFPVGLRSLTGNN